MARRPGLPHDRRVPRSGLPARELHTCYKRASIGGSALIEDDGITSPLMGSDHPVTARILARESGTVAGASMVDHMIMIWAPSIRIQWRAGDGRSISAGDELAELTGPNEDLLKIERSILNVLARLSGIATETWRWNQASPLPIAATRKVTWGLLDKWAVSLGSGLTHRLNRIDARMVKENDLAAMHPSEGSNADRLARYLLEADPSEAGAFLEIETRTEREAITAAAVWAKRREESGDLNPLVIMLDNMTPSMCASITEQVSSMGLREHVMFEASGRISYEDLSGWRDSGVDVLSAGAITQRAPPLDLTMLVDST